MPDGTVEEDHLHHRALAQLVSYNDGSGVCELNVLLINTVISPGIGNAAEPRLKSEKQTWAIGSSSMK